MAERGRNRIFIGTTELSTVKPRPREADGASGLGGLLLNLHDSPHQNMMSGEGADERVIAGLRRCVELQHLLFPMVDEFRANDEVRAFGNEPFGEAFGAHGDCLHGNFVGFAGFHDF